jgi:hypothetical protein
MVTAEDEESIYFDELEDVLSSVELIALLAPLAHKQPWCWKWLIVGAHDALQGAMVCTFTDSTGTSVLNEKSAKKMLAFLDNHVLRPEDYPKERLDIFGNLLRKCVRGSPTRERLELTRHECRDIRRLHAFRNDFAHFLPHHGWWIEKVGLPRIIGVALDTTEILMNRHEVATRMEEDRLQHLNDTLANAKVRVGAIPGGLA